jgi:hypothetical protein
MYVRNYRMIPMIGFNSYKGGFKMAKFGIDSNMIFDADGKSVATRLSDHDNSLVDIAYSVKSKGAKCDGVTDDWNAFVDACNYCVANGLVLYIPNTMKLVKTQDITIPTIIGNPKSKMIVSGNYSFLLSSGTKVKDIQIEETSNKGLFKANTSVDSVTFDNVEMTSNVSNMDGSVHGGNAIWFAGGITNLKMNKCTSANFNTVLYVTGQSSGIYIDDLKVTNFSTAIYLHGYDPKMPNGTWIDGVRINNLKVLNTTTQQTTMRAAGSVAGKDGMLFEYVSNAKITNVVCEYPAERVFYCSYGKTIKMSDFKLVNAGTIKFVGDNRKNIGAVYGTPVNNNISDGCWISNVVSETTLVDEACLDFYNARNIYVDNVYFDGTGVGDCFVFNKELVENINIKNCTAKNLKRGFWSYFDRAAGVPAINDGTNQIDAKPSADYDAWVKNVRFINNNMYNIGAWGYMAFRTDDDTSPSIGTYKFQDWLIEGNKCYSSQGIDSFDSASSGTALKGLIEINNISNVRIENNIVHGFRNYDSGTSVVTSFLPFIVGSNSYSVVIKHRHHHRFDPTLSYMFGNLYVSSGTEIELIGANRLYGLSGKTMVKVNASETDVQLTQLLDSNAILDSDLIIKRLTTSSAIYYGLYGNVTGGGTFPYPDTLYGYIDISDDSGNSARFQLKKDKTMVLKANSDANFSTTYDATKISIYKHATDPLVVLRGISSPAIVPINVSIKMRLQTAG